MDDDEDPIEQEISVFLSKGLAKNLYLLQYPVRPSFMPYDNVDLLAGRVKPDQKKLEVEVRLNTLSSHYSKSKGEQFALNVDGRDTDASSFYNSELMDKQVLTSQLAGSDPSRYAVGYLRQGELYLSPVQAQLQMRPSFTYLDKSDTRAESKLASQDHDSSQDEGEDEAKAVTVKFARPESDFARERRLASYGHLQRRQEEERWVNLNMHNTYSEMSERELEGLTTEVHDASNEFHVDNTEYLRMLMSHADEIQQEKPAMPSNVLSLTQLKSMPLNDQVKALLTNAKVIQFNQLLHLLPHGTDPQATLRALQIVAVMVQGCWVVKSEILYPKEVCSPNSGISSEVLCRGRDYVMWRFTQSRCVTRKEIASVIKLPSEDVKDILEQMSHIKINYGWEFVFQHDYDFTDRYSEIVDRQNMLWDCKFQTLSKQLNITEAQEKKIRELAAAEAQTDRPRRRRTSSRSRRRTLSGRSISDHSDMETEPTDVDLMVKDAQSKPKHAHKKAHNNHQNVLNGATMEISDEPIVTGSEKCATQAPSTEFLKELEDFIRDKLSSRFILSMGELTNLLHLKLAEEPPGHVLSTGVTDKLCEQIVIKIGGESIKAKWVREPVFIFTKSNDETQPVREIISDLLKVNNRVFKRSVHKRIEALPGFHMSDSEVKKIMQDYLVTKSSYWVPVHCHAWS